MVHFYNEMCTGPVNVIFFFFYSTLKILASVFELLIKICFQ